MPTHKKYTAYICQDCDIDFQVSKAGKKKAFCPTCGENLYTHKIKQLWMPRLLMHKRPWTDEEKEQIQISVEAGYSAKQVAELFEDRTYDAVRTKCRQLKRNKGVKGAG